MPKKTYRKGWKVKWADDTNEQPEIFTVLEDYPPANGSASYVSISNTPDVPGRQLALPEELELCS